MHLGLGIICPVQIGVASTSLLVSGRILDRCRTTHSSHTYIICICSCTARYPSSEKTMTFPDGHNFIILHETRPSAHLVMKKAFLKGTSKSNTFGPQNRSIYCVTKILHAFYNIKHFFFIFVRRK